MKYFKPMLLFLLILLALCVTVVSLTKLLRTSAGLYVGKEQTCIYTDAYRAGDYEQDEAMQDILADLIFFPVPESINRSDASVSYENSWMFERTYGGQRGHEGCDIMADINERGLYPIVSMTAGTIEKMGWLRQGGYRIGIRSTHGGYFYYAHLYSYAQGLEEGSQVAAGELIGYMGDSGYSDTVGTVGNFAVHLHVGFYINSPDGEEISLNPYPLLKKLESKKLKYTY